MNLRLLDNTKISAFKTCERYYYYRHVRDWTPERKSPPLIFGSAWGHALDVVWQRKHDRIASNADIVEEAYQTFIAKWVEEGMLHPSDMGPDELAALGARTPMVAKEMLHNYIGARANLFDDPTFELIAIEKAFAVPLDTHDASLFYVGRMDKVFRLRKRIIASDHKSTSSYAVKGTFQPSFLDSWSPNSQLDGYLYALRSLYGDIATSIWVDAALVHKKVHDGFKFIPIERQDAQLDAWLWTTRVWIDSLQGNELALEDPNATSGPYLAAFPQRTTACGNYGGCPYMDICKATAAPHRMTDTPAGYRLEKWEPVKALKLETMNFDEIIAANK